MKIGLANDEPVKRRFGKLNVYASNDDLFALGRVILTLVNDNQANEDDFDIYRVNKDRLDNEE